MQNLVTSGPATSDWQNNGNALFFYSLWPCDFLVFAPTRLTVKHKERWPTLYVHMLMVFCEAFIRVLDFSSSLA